MTIAVTGATGFVGQAVLDAAASRGQAVRALTRREQPDRAHVEWVLGDLANENALAALVQNCDAVLHIAGVVNAADEAGFLQGNVEGTRNVVAAARNANVRRCIHVSSLAAREPGLSIYGKSKKLAEDIVRESGLDWTIIRPPAVYGPRDTEMYELFRAAKLRIMPMPPKGRTSIIHVDDLARLLLDVLPADLTTLEQTFEPDDGTPDGWAHGDLAKAIGKAVGTAVWAPSMPKSVLMAAARVDRAVRGKRAKLTPDRARYMVHPDWVSHPAHHVPAELWSAAIATPKGLWQTAQWYRANGKL